MPEVFNISINYPLGQELRFANYVAEFGDGFEQRVNKNIAYSRADGNGNVASYKGINLFRIRLSRARHVNTSTTERVDALWKFYQDRLAGYDPFYFYNPIEAAVDLTGASTTGRYLVRFEDQNLTRDAFVLKLHSIGINFIEVRS